MGLDGEIERSDAQLLGDAVDDSEAFGLFYDRHVDALLGYFYRRTADHQVALDLTAETFAAAFAGRAGFRDTGAPARAWLIGIGRRQLGTFTRKAAVDLKYRRRMRIQPVPVSNEDLERIEAVADFAPAAAAIRDALAQLTPTISQAVHLRVVNDLPFAEVARRLGCTEGAARVRVSRGLTQMADTLEEHR